MGKSIADYLNKLEQIMLDDLESKHSKLKSNMTTLVDQMDQRARKIDQTQSEYTEMTHYATELQMYIGPRDIEKTTYQTAKYLVDVESGDHFSDKDLEVNVTSALQSILYDVKSFGDMKINTTSSTLQIKTGQKDQAHAALGSKNSWNKRYQTILVDKIDYSKKIEVYGYKDMSSITRW